eukprot:TRINITY_DN5638_c0_g2_i1.p1 TRINITY_DN5638_c0_g2~~TRINITY_DN5638_c0_g2_i1.p1  ORF type:complete len:922 (-),score=206.93 TRINITY_DN5638_c0_g2_i1:95-2860(-)
MLGDPLKIFDLKVRCAQCECDDERDGGDMVVVGHGPVNYELEEGLELNGVPKVEVPERPRSGIVAYSADSRQPLLGQPIRVAEVLHLPPEDLNSFHRAELSLFANGICVRRLHDNRIVATIAWSPFSLVQACRLHSHRADDANPWMRLFRISVIQSGVTHMFAVEGEKADMERARWVADIAVTMRVMTQSLFPTFDLQSKPLQGAVWTATRLLAGYMLLCNRKREGVILVYCELHSHWDSVAAFVAYEDEYCETRILYAPISLATTISERVGVDCSCFIVDTHQFSTRSAAEKTLWLRAISNVKVKLRHTRTNPTTKDLVVFRESISESFKDLPPVEAGSEKPLLPRRAVTAAELAQFEHQPQMQQQQQQPPEPSAAEKVLLPAGPGTPRITSHGPFAGPPSFQAPQTPPQPSASRETSAIVAILDRKSAKFGEQRPPTRPAFQLSDSPMSEQQDHPDAVMPRSVHTPASSPGLPEDFLSGSALEPVPPVPSAPTSMTPGMTPRECLERYAVEEGRVVRLGLPQAAQFLLPRDLAPMNSPPMLEGKASRQPMSPGRLQQSSAVVGREPSDEDAVASRLTTIQARPCTMSTGGSGRHGSPPGSPALPHGQLPDFLDNNLVVSKDRQQAPIKPPLFNDAVVMPVPPRPPEELRILAKGPVVSHQVARVLSDEEAGQARSVGISAQQLHDASPPLDQPQRPVGNLNVVQSGCRLGQSLLQKQQSMVPLPEPSPEPSPMTDGLTRGWPLQGHRYYMVSRDDLSVPAGTPLQESSRASGSQPTPLQRRRSTPSSPLGFANGVTNVSGDVIHKVGTRVRMESLERRMDEGEWAREQARQGMESALRAQEEVPLAPDINLAEEALATSSQLHPPPTASRAVTETVDALTRLPPKVPPSSSRSAGTTRLAGGGSWRRRFVNVCGWCQRG